MSTGLNLALLQVCKYKEQYEKVRSFVFDSALDEFTETLLKDIDRYYQEYPNDETINLDMFSHLFFNKWHKGLNQEGVNTWTALLQRMMADVSHEQQVGMINYLVEEKLATQLAHYLEEYQNGEDLNILHTIEGLVANAKAEIESADKETFGTIESLKENRKSGCNYQWPHKCLSTKMRPLQGGDSIIIAALSDTGKTSFTLFLITFFAYFTDKPFLWFNNEGSKEKIQKRAYGMMLAATVEQIEAWIDDGTLAERLANKYGRPVEQVLRIYDSHGKNTQWHEQTIKETSEEDGVAGVIWDMLDNVKVTGHMAGLPSHDQLEQKYQWARELGVLYDYPTLSTSQQSSNQEWQKWPALHELKGSKVGKQGACDVLMFLTKPEEAAKDTYRYISTPKNKLAIPTAPSVHDELRWNKVFGVTYEEQMTREAEVPKGAPELPQVMLDSSKVTTL